MSDVEWGVRFYGRGPFEEACDSYEHAVWWAEHGDDKHGPARVVWRTVGDWSEEPLLASPDGPSDAPAADAGTPGASGADDGLREALRAILDNEPLIVSGIRRDMEHTRFGRGGELRHYPATTGHGMSGCPGDNLIRWIDDLQALLDEDALGWWRR